MCTLTTHMLKRFHTHTCCRVGHHRSYSTTVSGAGPSSAPSSHWTAALSQVGLNAANEARERTERMARPLAHDCAKKVYVTLYAEGPTRVLCFAEDKTDINSLEDDSSVPALMARWGRRRRRVWLDASHACGLPCAEQHLTPQCHMRLPEGSWQGCRTAAVLTDGTD